MKNVLMSDFYNASPNYIRLFFPLLPRYFHKSLDEADDDL